MHLASMVEMVESGFDERVLLADPYHRVTGEFGRLKRRGAAAELTEADSETSSWPMRRAFQTATQRSSDE
jgi:hypothetical protein